MIINRGLVDKPDYKSSNHDNLIKQYRLAEVEAEETSIAFKLGLYDAHYIVVERAKSATVLKSRALNEEEIEKIIFYYSSLGYDSIVF